MKKVELSDNSYAETYENLETAASAVIDWYAILFENDVEAMKQIDIMDWPTPEEFTQLDQLNDYIANVEEIIARQCNYAGFHGHGSFSVNAASQMGLNLSARYV